MYPTSVGLTTSTECGYPIYPQG